MHDDFIRAIESNPIIAAVKDDEGLKRALKTDVGIIFTLYGDVCAVQELTERIKDAGKLAMVHVDLITGLNTSRDIAVDFIRRHTGADGIITTKGGLIPRAKELGLYTVLRYFLLDSMAMVNIEKQARHGTVQPDIIEVLPGVVVPKVIRRISEIVRVPLIAGGLITDREDVMNALSSGALAISTTNEAVWRL